MLDNTKHKVYTGYVTLKGAIMKKKISTKAMRSIAGQALLGAMSIGFIMQYIPQVNKIGVVLIAVAVVALVLYFANN